MEHRIRSSNFVFFKNERKRKSLICKSTSIFNISSSKETRRGGGKHSKRRCRNNPICYRRPLQNLTTKKRNRLFLASTTQRLMVQSRQSYHKRIQGFAQKCGFSLKHKRPPAGKQLWCSLSGKAGTTHSHTTHHCFPCLGASDQGGVSSWFVALSSMAAVCTSACAWSVLASILVSTDYQTP